MPKKETKDKISSKINEYFDRFSNVVLCEIKNLPANNIHRVRKDMRDLKSEVLCGKTVNSFFKIL